MRSGHRALLGGTLLALAAPAAGCAPLGVGPAAVTNVPRGSEEHALPTGTFQGRLEQRGTALTVQVERLCNIERFDVVERTTVRSYENTAPANSVWTGIGGALFAGLGGTLAASPSTFGDGSDSSNKQVRTAGVGVLAVGAALLVIPAIDYLRAHREAERKVERVAEPGPMLRHAEACGVAPTGTKIALELAPGYTTVLGATDDVGNLHVDLRAAVPSAWRFQRSDRAFVRIDESGLGDLSLAELYASRDDDAWQKLAASPCIDAAVPIACDGERDYLRGYPEGGHAKDSQDRIAGAEARHHAAEEDDAWRALDLAACAKPSAKSTSSDVEAACRPLHAFVAAYPSSAHAPELDAALAREPATRARLDRAAGRAPASPGSRR